MKFTCNECGNSCTCDVNRFIPVNCLRAKYENPVWVAENAEKLTREVFMLGECPAWAEYACVNRNRTLIFTETKPYILEDRYWSANGRVNAVMGCDYYTENWKTDIIKRHRLPKWCVQDSYIYDSKLNAYAEVLDIVGLDENVVVRYEGNMDNTDLSVQYVLENCVKARCLCYEEEDMEDLVGEVLFNPVLEKVCLATQYRDELLLVGEDWLTNTDLMQWKRKKDKSSCYILQVYKNGRWISGTL